MSMFNGSAVKSVETPARLPMRRWPHHTAGEVAMPVVQRHAVATVDSTTDKATVLVSKSRGIAMRVGSARKATMRVVESLRALMVLLLTVRFSEAAASDLEAADARRARR